MANILTNKNKFSIKKIIIVVISLIVFGIIYYFFSHDKHDYGEANYLYEKNGLEKYSYLGHKVQIRSLGNSNMEEKTSFSNCFFIRTHDKLFLLTAQHCINRPDSLGKMDTYWIKLYNEKEEEFQSFPINVSSPSIFLPERFRVNYKDFVIIPVKIPSDFKINSIEDFLMDKDLDSTSIQSIVNYSIFALNTPGIPFPYERDSILIDSGYSDLHSPLTFTNNRLDTINYEYMTHLGNFGQGSSGSPMFIKLKNGKIVFGGIGTAKDPTSPLVFFIRYKIIIDSLNHIK